MGQGQSLATITDPLVQRQGACREAGDGKHWQTNSRRRGSHLENAGTESRSYPVAHRARIPSPPITARVHPQEQRRATSPLDPDGSFILPSLQAAFGITLSPWTGSAGPTVILLYHILLVLAKVPSFPMALNRLAKLCDDLRCQRNPPRAVGACSNTL